MSKVSEFSLLSAGNKTRCFLYSLKQSWDSHRRHDERGPQAGLPMARCPVLLPCHPIVRKNFFPLGCLAFNKLANFDKNCFAGIFSASSSGSVSNNYMLAKTADSAERGKSMFSFYQRERIKWQTGKAEFNFNSQAHPSVPFYSTGAP